MRRGPREPEPPDAYSSLAEISVATEFRRVISPPLVVTYSLRMHEMTNDLERYDGQHQNYCKENDRTVLEPFPARSLDAVQNPVGGKIKPDSCHCEVDYFHVVGAPRLIVAEFYRVVVFGN